MSGGTPVSSMQVCATLLWAAPTTDGPALVLEFQIRGLDPVAEQLDVALDPAAEFFARPAARIDRHGLELLAHAGVRQRATDLGIELLDDRGRRVGGHEESAPQADIDVGIA